MHYDPLAASTLTEALHDSARISFSVQYVLYFALAMQRKKLLATLCPRCWQGAPPHHQVHLCGSLDGVASCCRVLIAIVCRDLGKRFGKQMTYIWAIGLLAAGQSSTIAGTYTGQIAMEGFMDIHMPKWKRNTITRLIAMVPTVAVAAAFSGSSKLDELNQLLNVVQSVQLPFALIPVLYMCSRSDIMGERFVLRDTFRTVVQSLSAFLLGLNLLLVVQQVLPTDSSSKGLLSDASVPVIVCVAVVSIAYAAFVIYLLVGPAFVWEVLEGYEDSDWACTLRELFGQPRGDGIIHTASLDAVPVQQTAVRQRPSEVVQLEREEYERVLRIPKGTRGKPRMQTAKDFYRGSYFI
jgi:hypothetical protein